MAFYSFVCTFLKVWVDDRKMVVVLKKGEAYVFCILHYSKSVRKTVKVKIFYLKCQYFFKKRAYFFKKRAFLKLKWQLQYALRSSSKGGGAGCDYG